VLLVVIFDVSEKFFGVYLGLRDHLGTRATVNQISIFAEDSPVNVEDLRDGKVHRLITFGRSVVLDEA